MLLVLSMAASAAVSSTFAVFATRYFLRKEKLPKITPYEGLWGADMEFAVPDISSPLKDFRKKILNLPDGFSWKASLEGANTIIPSLTMTIVKLSETVEGLPQELASWTVSLDRASSYSTSFAELRATCPLTYKDRWNNAVAVWTDEINREAYSYLRDKHDVATRESIVEYI